MAGLATSLGAGAATNSLAQMPEIDTLFLFDSNPTEGHPIVSLYLKAALANGAKMIVGDPRKTWMAKRADVWLSLAPATENAMAITNLALVCGHIGRPATGIMALRGQNNVQGASDLGPLPGPPCPAISR